MRSRCIVAGERAHVMNENAPCVLNVLAQNITISDVFPGVNQSVARCGHARNGVEEVVAEHDVRKRSLIHIEPHIWLDKRVAVVNEHYLLCTDLHDCWCCTFHFFGVAMIQEHGITIAPGGSSANEFPSKGRMD